MRVSLLLVFFGALVHAQETSQTQPIGGTAVHARTGEPLENVQVSIVQTYRQDRNVSSVTTASDGRFQFRVPKGNYILYAERNGLGRQVYGARQLGDSYGVSLIADGSQAYDNLSFRLHPLSAISGRVIDPFGEPVESALVEVLRSTVVAGRKRLTVRGYAYTNDQGEYRVGNLAAGQYYLTVGGTPWHSTRFAYEEKVDAAKAAYIPMYYPNTQNPSAAAPLTVGAGEEGRADFTLQEGSGVPIHVRIAGTFGPGLRILLTAAGVAGLNRYQLSSTIYGDTYEIESVPPGTYEVTVNGMLKGQFVSGSATIEAADTSRDVTVTVGVPPTVSGTFTCDGKPVPAGNSIGVMLWNETRGQVMGRRIERDGSFRIPAVATGPATVQLSNSPDCFVQRVLLDGKELKDRALPIGTSDISGLVVEGRGGVGQVKGFVRRKEASAPGVFVYLAPVKESPDASEYPSYMTDSDGSFHFPWVRPGEYYLYAVDEIDFEFRNREVIAPYLQRAERVVVSPHGKHQKDVQLGER